MARDELARKSEQDKSLLNRRSYLRLAGTAAASVATFGAGASASTSSDDLLLREDFESGDYAQNYTGTWRQGEYDGTTSQVAKNGSSCLKVDIDAGNHYGVDATYDPVAAGDADTPTRTLYQSYWVRFDKSFQQADNPKGKLPGIAMTETGAGFGSKFDGISWSARGKFQSTGSEIELRYYVYNIDTSGSYGTNYSATTVPTGEWHRVEQEVALNTTDGGSANADGALRMWVDGQLCIDESGIRWTTEPDRGCHSWFNIYHGGSAPASDDLTINFDDWQVAQSRTDGGGATEPSGDVLELIAGPDTSNVSYEFTVDGNVQKRTSAGDLPAESNDTITDNGDGTKTVSGVAGGGHGDSYYVDGSITSMSLDEPKWTIRYNDQQVSVDDIVESPGPVVDRFDISKSETLGTDRMFSVRWAVSSSDEELDSVEVVAVENSSDMNFSVTDASGADASGWNLFQFPTGTQLDVSLRVEDAAGNVTKKTKSITL